MEIAVLFWAVMAVTCTYAVLRGGWEGRATAAIIILASLARLFMASWIDIQWHQMHLTRFLIDLMTLAVMYLVAVFSRRWWPLWVAAFQLNSAAVHLVTSLSPQLSGLVCQGCEGLWAVPGQIVMIIGIFRDRARKYRYELA